MARRDPLEGIDEVGRGHLWGHGDQQVQVVGFAVHLLELASEVGTNFRKNGLEKFPDPSRDGPTAKLGHKDQMIMKAVNDCSSSADAGFHIH
jgi:hypothetical protein